MPAFFVYLDECVDHRLLDYLRQRGFTVTSVHLEGTRGYDDEAQLAFATQRGWVLLTTNSDEFVRRHRAWRRRGQEHAGLVTLPQSGFPRLALRAAIMLDWIATTYVPGPAPLWRWTDCQQWLNRGGHLAGYSVSEVDFAVGRRPAP